MLKPHLPTLDDIEGYTIPAGLPRVIDAHVHVFPDGMFKAVRRWFDENAWHIRYQLSTSRVFDFLLSHGVGHIINAYRLDRIMYGSDFPNIPYAWDRELKWLRDSCLGDDELDMILNKNAVEFFHLDV